MSTTPLTKVLSDLRSNPRPNTTAPTPPESLRPKLSLDTATGEGTVQGLFETPELPTNEDWDDALTRLGFDPDVYEIVGHLRVSAWDCPGHGTLYSHRAQIRRKSPNGLTEEDYADLLTGLYDVIPALDPTSGIADSPHWPSSPTEAPDANEWVTLATGDWHIGKGFEAGGGTDLLVERYREAIIQTLPELAGKNVHLALMGDLIEGLASQGGAAVGTSDLGVTEQLRVARHLVVWTVKTIAAHTHGDIRVSAVPGNHGDVDRRHEVAAHDSHDIGIPGAAQEVMDETIHADRLTWVYPDPTHEYVIHDLGDTRMATVHGHRSRKGASKEAKMENYLKDAALNGSVVASTDIILAGHYHNPSWSMLGPRSIIYTPALESASTWFRRSTHAENFTPGVMLITTDGSPVPTSIRPIVVSDKTTDKAA